MTSRLVQSRTEFRRFVWNHAEDQFQAKFDRRAALTERELAILRALLTPTRLDSATKMAEAVSSAVAKDSIHLRLLLQLTGLTRNKIVQDIKAFARYNNLPISTSSPESLFRSEQGRDAASKYLARQLLRVFGHSRGTVSDDLLETVNQATWLGYIRQERAKRMGHEAEYRLACLFRDCGIPFEPPEKAENPLCRDAQVHGISYDLVVPDAQSALLRVKATVHTANIGQYGESKDHLEILAAKAAIRKSRQRADVVLLAFVDGVGFESNKKGLDGVLENADEFCQFRTLWKATAIASTVVGRETTVALSLDQHSLFSHFCTTYNTRMIDRRELDESPDGWTEAGDAWIRIQ